MNLKNIVTAILLSMGLFTSATSQQEKKVKNVIMMIPDGTSTSVLSLARWYKYGICPADSVCWLTIDKLICGLVKTHSSDAPIGDSAPTGSTYATGYLSQSGYVATYPKSAGKGKDLVYVNPKRAYQPLFTVLEAAKINRKSTGLVVTCQFTHATPADFSAHTHERDELDLIAKQMVYNNIDVVFGGGTQYLDPLKRNDKLDLVSTLKNFNYKYINKMHDFKSLKPTNSKVWGLFANGDLPFDIDRNNDSVPSLAEMTEKSIEILSSNPEGFFLMVEGSKVDWAAHNNDPVGVVSEFVAFDKAVQVALNFAKNDGNTAIVICPDHGNSGISIGNERSNKSYDTLCIESLMSPLTNCKYTAEGMAKILNSLTDINSIPKVFAENTNIKLTPLELSMLKETVNKNFRTLTQKIAKIYTDHSYIGFTSMGHTGEDVMLAMYHPRNYRLSGIVKNTEVNTYLKDILGGYNLDSLSNQYYCIDTLALKGYLWQINANQTSKNYSTLVIRKEAKAAKHAEIEAYTNYVTIYNNMEVVKKINLNSIAIYVSVPDENISRFYIQKTIGEILEKEI